MAHQHNHSMQGKDFGKAFMIGIALNTLFIIFEIIYGLKANSLALLADAGHNVSDVIGLFIAWIATILAKRKASKNFTYGLQSATIIAALINIGSPKAVSKVFKPSCPSIIKCQVCIWKDWVVKAIKQAMSKAMIAAIAMENAIFNTKEINLLENKIVKTVS